MKRTVMKITYLLTLVFGMAVSAQDVEIVQILDKNLEQAIREEIGISATIPLTPAHMKMLKRLVANGRSITDLTGLEYATNLERLGLYKNYELNDIRSIANLTNLSRLSLARTQVDDLSPLTNLINLKVLYLWNTPISNLKPLESLKGLVDIDASGCKISDVTPLASLTQLKYLKIRYNLIEDVTPIGNLTQLIELNLSYNQLVDVRPLAKLINLKKLWIQGNQITDHSPLDTLSLTVFEYDQSCVLPRLSIDSRIQNRRFPSIFAAWGGIIGWNSVLDRPEKSDLEQMALHDLYFCCLIFGQKFRDTSDGKRVMGEMTKALELRDAYLAQNPNMLFIAEIRMREAFSTTHPEDSPYWLRNKNGERVPGWPGTFFLDFTKPVVIDKIVDETIAVAKCGLYDGIFFDWWSENGVILADGSSEGPWGADETSGYRGFQAEQNARDIILSRIRAAVADDFLILVNTNRNKTPRTAWGINGTFMETGRDYDEGYTYEGLKQIESTLSWAEENLQEPRINCLEGWGVTTESPDSPLNRKWMRVFTTMSLTHSDGYVLYNDGIQHQHYWYDFWDTDLDKPIGDKGQLYEKREGLFIREFTNGWAVYNRTGKAQEIEFSEYVSGVFNKSIAKRHVIPDLDGEIYLKGASHPADLNGDGVVNIQDLVLVAGKFGETGQSTVDVNGDGVVNIQDLVIVANAL